MIVECQASIFKQFEDGSDDFFVQWERDSNSCMKHAYKGEYLGLKAVKKVGHFNNLSQLDS